MQRPRPRGRIARLAFLEKLEPLRRLELAQHEVAHEQQHRGGDEREDALGQLAPRAAERGTDGKPGDGAGRQCQQPAEMDVRRRLRVAALAHERQERRDEQRDLEALAQRDGQRGEEGHAHCVAHAPRRRRAAWSRARRRGARRRRRWCRRRRWYGAAQEATLDARVAAASRARSDASCGSTPSRYAATASSLARRAIAGVGGDIGEQAARVGEGAAGRLREAGAHAQPGDGVGARAVVERRELAGELRVGQPGQPRRRRRQRHVRVGEGVLAARQIASAVAQRHHIEGQAPAIGRRERLERGHRRCWPHRTSAHGRPAPARCATCARGRGS